MSALCPKTIRLYPVIILITLLSTGCQPSVKNHQAEAPPNIILIVADDQGWGDLSLTGNPVVETPHLDSLARQGAFFENFYVSAVCSPTRAELLTGRYAVRGGVYSTSAGGERLDLDEITFAQILQDAGYRTGAFGKWHNGMQPPYHPNARGFEEFYGYCSGHWGSYFDAELEHNGQIVQSGGFLTDVLTDRAMAFIDEHQQEPFLVYLPLNTPHSPMQVPDRWWKKFESMELPQHRYREREDLDHSRAAYAMAENIDWNVGRLTRLLAELGLDERTVVVYLSDNGPNGWRWNAGMEGIKGSVDEGGLKSPLIVHWPAHVSPGLQVDAIASSLDLFPTLLEIATIQDPESLSVDGNSLLPLLGSEDSVSWSDRILVSHWREQTSVRTQRFRLDDAGQLFDLEADPGQTRDVAAQYPEVRDQMSQTRLNWRETVLTELPSEDLRPFPVGHPSFSHTQLPARDAVAHGNLQRSNRWPNCSFFTNWTSEADSLIWEVEVLTEGEYEVVVYYTGDSATIGTELAVSFRGEHTEASILEAHTPPLRGMEHDRIPRGESYVKEFAPLALGSLFLSKGPGPLTLTTPKLASNQGPDIRRIMLWRKN